MGNITNEAFRKEFQKFAFNNTPSSTWKYELELICGDYSFKTSNFDSYIVERDFTGVTGEVTYTDRQLLTMPVSRTNYKKHLYPNRKSLKIRVVRRRSLSGNRTLFGDVETFVYNAKLINPIDFDALVLNSDVTDNNLEDISSDFTVEFQLFDQAMVQCHMSSRGGVYQNTTLEGILKVFLGLGLDNQNISASVLADPSYEGVRGVDVVPPVNDKPIPIIEIPITKRLVDLPHYLQREYGLYPTGLGSYLLNGKWFIYPLYDYNSFSSREKVMTIINYPSFETAGLETTYRVEGGNLYVLANDETNMSEQGEGVHLNVGNSLRYLRATTINGGLSEVSANKSTYDLEKNQKVISLFDDPSGHNHTVWHPDVFTNNPFPALAEMAKAEGRFINLIWNNSNPDLVYPGMPVRYMYSAAGNAKQIDGVIAYIKTTVVKADAAITSTNYYSQSVLSIFVKQNSE